MTLVPVTRCQYCGSQDIGEGWQHGEALVTFKYHGLLGNRLKYLICRRCGAVLYQCVAEPICPPGKTGYMSDTLKPFYGRFYTPLPRV